MTLAVQGLRKSYGGQEVLRGIDLRVADGEIHALLGPNGSGKSTLIRCLSGAAVPDAGTVSVDGREYAAFTPETAFAAGTAVIYQHFSLIPSLSVVDNVFLGSELRAGGRIQRSAQEAIAGDVLRQLGRPLPPQVPVGSLRTGDRQIVEIAKALRHRPRLLILDEPTAALGEQEARNLGLLLRRLRQDGLAILYVTHILSEVFEIADGVTVLRDGAVVLADRVDRLSPSQVIQAISPRAGATGGRQGGPPEAAPPILRMAGFAVEGVGPVDLDLVPGAVVGVFGLLGSGRTELLEGLYGIRPATAGSLHLHGRDYRPRTPRDALRAGIALVAGDRLRQSLLDRMSALDNVQLPHTSRLARSVLRNRRAERAEFDRVATALRLHPPAPEALAWSFSGGNQQKLAVGRWLTPSARVDVLLMDEPTQGIDVGARGDLYATVRQIAGDGKGVVFTSSDAAETLALADRVLVLRRGAVVADLPRARCDEETLLALAHGTETDAGRPPEAAAASPEQPNGEAPWSILA